MIAPGTRIRVRNDWPETRGPCHIRTPHYVRGQAGTVLRHLGDFPNPEDLAFGRPADRLPLYHVLFERPDLWAGGPATDDILIELFEPWLETAP
jgi:nitrile hydratase subunit beta